MLNCNSCGFVVTKEMGFCIKQNRCPSCGTSLMDNEFIADVKKIKAEISASKILLEKSKEEILNLLGIFIKNKFMKKEEPSEEDNVLSFTEENTPVIEDEMPETVGSLDEDRSFEDIRNEVRSEFLHESLEDEDEDSRVQRLKSLARNSPTLKKMGVAVRRVSGD